MQGLPARKQLGGKPGYLPAVVFVLGVQVQQVFPAGFQNVRIYQGPVRIVVQVFREQPFPQPAAGNY